MPEIIVNCPQCQRPLRVTEDLLGRLVRCPACGLTLTVPPPSGTGPVPQLPSPLWPPQVAYQPTAACSAGPGELRSADSGGAHWGSDRARTALMPPAIGLLMIGILGVLGNALRVLATLLAGNNPPPDELPEFLKQALAHVSPEMEVAFAALFVTVNALIILGAVQMLRLRTYGLAIASSILSMANCGCACCIPGLPVGIWALIVLVRPEVRSAFE